MKKILCQLIIFWMMAENIYSENIHHSVSVTELLAVPEKFVGLRIRVKGYYVAHSGGFLYLSKEHSDFLYNMSYIMVADQKSGKDTLSFSSCRNQYVEIKGIFKQTQYSNIYALFDVEKAFAIKLNEWCWEKPKE